MIRDLIVKSQIRRLSQQIESSCGPPVIIIGMHRSGTSLVTRLLREAGGYFGTILEHNSEAMIFMDLNDAILEYFGANWFRVHDFYNDLNGEKTGLLNLILANEDLLWSEFFSGFGDECVEKKMTGFHYKLSGPLALSRLLFMKKSNIPKTDNSFWGWKDPRNTLTLPVWLSIFPNARVIHVIRNGVDVSLSLSRRCLEAGTGAPDCRDLLFCFRLWESYLERGLHFRSFLSTNQYCEIQYEDLLNDPETGLRKLSAFIGRPEIECATSQINENSRFKQWKNCPDLMEAARGSKLFKFLGYDRLIKDLSLG